jgi:transcriptional regulator with XRE-family HTH domain
MAAKGKDKDALGLFADEMRAHRVARGWTQAELAAELHYSDGLVGQVESCYKAPSKEFAKALDRVFQTPGFTGEGGLGTFGRQERRIGSMPFPPSFRSFTPFEAAAVSLSTYQHSLVPGLLQTPEYARAVLETKPNAGEDEIESLIAGRLERQSVLTRSEPPAPLLMALIDEGALHRPVAPPGVMADQIAYLVEMSRRPNITVQVVPYSAGGHTGLLGSFDVAEPDSGEAIVFVEDIADGRVSDDAATVRQVTLRFRSLQSEALPKSASRTVMESVRQEWKETTAP